MTRRAGYEYKKAEIIIIARRCRRSVAYHLTERGAKDVLITERENLLGKGSTGKATGGVRAQFETEINIKMSLYSLDFFERFEDLTGIDCAYEPRGYLFVATDEKQFEFLKKSVEKQKMLGCKSIEIVDTKTISQMIEGLNCADIVGGSFGARDGFINPLGVLEGFAEKAIENGAEILNETEVYSIEPRTEKLNRSKRITAASNAKSCSMRGRVGAKSSRNCELICRLSL